MRPVNQIEISPTSERGKRAIARVELGLHHGSREECFAAINEAFSDVVHEDESVQVTAETLLAELCLPLRLINALEHERITTVFQVWGMSDQQLLSVPNMSLASVQRIRRATAKG